MAAMRVSDLTVEELRTLLRQEMAGLVREAVREALADVQGEKQLSLDDFPVDDLGSWPEGFTLRREDIYGDDGR